MTRFWQSGVVMVGGAVRVGPRPNAFFKSERPEKKSRLRAVATLVSLGPCRVEGPKVPLERLNRGPRAEGLP